MKILYISSSSDWGGASVALYNLIKSLICHHEIHVLLPKEEGKFVDLLNTLGASCYFIDYTLTIRPKLNNLTECLKYPIRIWKLLLKTRKARNSLTSLIDNIKPDIVHTNVGPLDIALDICKNRRIPHIWHLREYQDLDFGMTFFPNKKKFYKRIHSTGNYNIAITKGVYNYWKLRPCDSVIYDGVFDEEQLKRNLIICHEKYFLFVGRVQEAKGVHYAIKSFQQIHKRYPEYKLLIAGQCIDSIYKKRCENMISKAQINNHVLFLGERNDVYELMSKAVALIVPSRFEGFGFITVEAMINRCLVIGRNTAGTKEQFDNGLEFSGQEIGLRFSTINELTKQMERAINEDFQNICGLAFQTASSLYGVQTHAETVETFYKKILNTYEPDCCC